MKALSETEIRNGLKDLTDWTYQNGALEAHYRFANFKEAFAAMTRIAFECEAMDHHPNWENVYNTLQIRLYTHDINGVGDKDLALAQTIEKLMRATQG